MCTQRKFDHFVLNVDPIANDTTGKARVHNRNNRARITIDQRRHRVHQMCRATGARINCRPCLRIAGNCMPIETMTPNFAMR